MSDNIQTLLKGLKDNPELTHEPFFGAWLEVYQNQSADAVDCIERLQGVLWVIARLCDETHEKGTFNRYIGDMARHALDWKSK